MHRRLNHALVVVPGVGLAVCLGLAWSCGSKSSSSDAAATATETASTTSAETRATAAGVVAVFAAGVLPDGAVGAAAQVDAPSEFSALEGAPAASKAVSVTAKLGDTELTETLAPYQLAITLDAAADLADQEKTTANLCLVAKAASGLFVWRAGGFTVDGDALKVETKLLGVFQAIYCGSLAMENFTLAAGEKPAEVATQGDGTGPIACDAHATKTSDGSPLGRCYEWPAKLRDDTDSLQEMQSNCAALQGTFVDGGDCPADGRVGSCVETTTKLSDNTEFATTVAYYTPTYADGSAHDACQEKADEYAASPSEDESHTFEYVAANGKKTSVTPSTTTDVDTSTDVATGTDTSETVDPVYCDITSLSQCIKAIGSSKVTQVAAQCVAYSGSVVTGCNDADFAGSCHLYVGQIGEVLENYYPGATHDHSSQSGCEADGGIWSTDFAP